MSKRKKSLNRRVRELASGRSEATQDLLRGGYLALAGAWSSARRAVGAGPWVHVVVCGFPRSGTSLLYNMLSATLPGFECQEFEVPASLRLTWAGNQASKNPLDVLELHRLPEANPLRKRLLAIIPLRDPRDVLTSIHPKLPDRYFIGWDHSWWPGREGRPWSYTAAGVCEIADAIRGARGVPGLDVLVVKYEDLVADPDTVQSFIGSEAGLRFSGAFSTFHERPDLHAYRYEGKWAPADASLVRENRKVDMQRAGKWRDPRHRDRLLEQFSACPRLFEVVRELGYESDDSWFEVIGGTVA